LVFPVSATDPVTFNDLLHAGGAEMRRSNRLKSILKTISRPRRARVSRKRTPGRNDFGAFRGSTGSSDDYEEETSDIGSVSYSSSEFSFIDSPAFPIEGVTDGRAIPRRHNLLDEALRQQPDDTIPIDDALTFVSEMIAGAALVGDSPDASRESGRSRKSQGHSVHSSARRRARPGTEPDHAGS
jgi:hypothetical protein